MMSKQTARLNLWLFLPEYCPLFLCLLIGLYLGGCSETDLQTFLSGRAEASRVSPVAPQEGAAKLTQAEGELTRKQYAALLAALGTIQNDGQVQAPQSAQAIASLISQEPYAKGGNTRWYRLPANQSTWVGLQFNPDTAKFDRLLISAGNDRGVTP